MIAIERLRVALAEIRKPGISLDDAIENAFLMNEMGITSTPLEENIEEMEKLVQAGMHLHKPGE